MSVELVWVCGTAVINNTLDDQSKIYYKIRHKQILVNIINNQF